MFQKEIIEAAFYDLLDKQPFYGGLLQEIDVGFASWLPTAALKYDKKTFRFEILINYDFFKKLERKCRGGVLFHEVLHFTHKHTSRALKMNIPKEELKLANIAQDIAINQFIQDLPEGCVKVEMFKTVSGQPFPLKDTFEVYFKLLKQGKDEEKKGGKDPNEEVMKKFGEGSVHLTDEHLEDVELSEEEHKAMLEEIAKKIERTIEKTSYGKDRVPDHVKDLLQEIEAEIKGINYKKILRDTIKRKLSGNNRTNTWNRPSKRFGNVAPGTTQDQLPELAIFVDTSGSISMTEINEFLRVIDGFLTAGARKCTIGLWHTTLYKTAKYKKGQDFNQLGIESGGTDVTGVLDYIYKNNPNLSIILSDMCYYHSFNKKMHSDVIWVASKNGSIEHDLKNKIGKTIKIT